MTSHTTDSFRRELSHLPERIQRQAGEAYRRFTSNPYHPGLWFKQVHSTKPIYSVRISRGYRALGVRDGDHIIWFWIGSHTDYEDLISRM